LSLHKEIGEQRSESGTQSNALITSIGLNCVRAARTNRAVTLLFIVTIHPVPILSPKEEALFVQPAGHDFVITAR